MRILFGLDKKNIIWLDKNSFYEISFDESITLRFIEGLSELTLEDDSSHLLLFYHFINL